MIHYKPIYVKDEFRDKNPSSGLVCAIRCQFLNGERNAMLGANFFGTHVY